MWWLTNTVPGLERWRQDDSEFKATGTHYVVILKQAWQHDSLQMVKALPCPKVRQLDSGPWDKREEGKN